MVEEVIEREDDSFNARENDQSVDENAVNENAVDSLNDQVLDSLNENAANSSNNLSSNSQNDLSSNSLNDLPASHSLLIKYLILHNFKSYAGTHKIGPFDTKFTAIVGPNGSGKSNVIDALLFVFGWKAKKMRQSKLSDLIHSQEPKDCAFVTVEFQESNGNCFSICRKVLQDSKSEYYFNGQPSNYTNITKLLREKGVDLDHKRFLILQGEVEAIALMKPKGSSEHEEGLLEYLEDIIGTNQLIPEIAKASLEYEELAPEESKLANRMKVAESELRAAEQQKQSVFEAIQEENAFRQNKACQLQIDRFSLRQQEQKLQDKLACIRQQAEQEISALEQEIASEMLIEPTSLQETVSKSEKEHTELKRQIDSKRKAICSLQEEEKAQKLNLKRINKTFEEESSKATQRNHSIEQLRLQIQSKSTQLQTTESQLESAKQVLELLSQEVSQKTTGIQAQIDSLNGELMPIKAGIAQKQKEISQSEHELASWNQEKRENLSKLSQTTEAIQELERTIQEKSQESAHYQSSTEKLFGKLKDSQSKAHEINEQIALKRSKLEDLRDEEAIQSDSSSTTGSQNQRGKFAKLFADIPGVHGRLGDLGAVEEKFALAVNSAAGTAMENFVVQDTQTAQRCVQRLKEHSAGRCTFIILDRIVGKAKSQDSSADSFPSTRLVDLIKMEDERYFDAFWHALKDTLISEKPGMEAANSLAFGKRKRYRVVTLDGKLIDISGTISGGGNHSNSLYKGNSGSYAASERGISIINPLKSSSQSPSSSPRISPEELARQIQELESEIAQLTTQADSHNASIEEYSTLLAEVEATIKKNENDILWLSKTKTCNEAHLATWKAKASEHQMQQPKYEALEREISTSKQLLSEMQIKSSGICSSISQLKEAILEAGGIQYRTAFSRCESLQEEQEMLTSLLCKLKAELELACKAQEKHAESEKIWEKKIEQSKSALSQVQNQLSQAEKALEELCKKQSEAASLLSQSQSHLAAFQEQQQRIELSRQNLKNLRRNFQKEAQSLQSEIQTISQSVERITQELNSFCLLSCTGFSKNTETSSPDDNDNDAIRLYEDEEIQNFSSSFRKKILQAISKERKFINFPNIQSTLARYQSAQESANRDSKAFESIHSQREASKARALALRKQRHEAFMQGFWTISLHLKSLYQTLTQGGNAELELVDSLDPFGEGVVLSVMPPRKSWKPIAHLSGGEKTLASLALVLALHAFKPTPFYVMDEIDAALDWRNVSIIAAYLKERASLDAQFVVISLRSGMFELADRMVGVYKQQNCSRIVCCE